MYNFLMRLRICIMPGIEGTIRAEYWIVSILLVGTNYPRST